ncbi:MAG: hypothetical protein ACXAEN_27390 [Candidatus Thorarchaeota archaeon]|jgi:hypothetical protein
MSDLPNNFWEPSKLYFDELLIHDPDNDGWRWFYKGYRSIKKFDRYFDAQNNFTTWRNLVRQGKAKGMRHEVRTDSKDEAYVPDYRHF